jgi:hypothetical protein
VIDRSQTTTFKHRFFGRHRIDKFDQDLDLIAFCIAGFVRTGAGLVTGSGHNTKFVGLLMGKINGKELEKRCIL